MKKAKTKRLFYKLNYQIQELSQNIPDNFLLLGESLHYMSRENIFEVKHPNFEIYMRDELPYDRSVAFKLRRVYEYFQPYKESLMVWGKLKVIGWKKARELVVNQEKFEKALSKKVFDLSSLLNLANSLTTKDLGSYLEKKTEAEFCAEVVNHTMSPSTFDSPKDVLIKRIQRLLGRLGYLEYFNSVDVVNPFKIDAKVSEKIKTLDEAEDILASLNKAHYHLKKVNDFLDLFGDISRRRVKLRKFRSYPNRSISNQVIAPSYGAKFLKNNPEPGTLTRYVVKLVNISRFLNREMKELKKWAHEGYITVVTSEKNKVEKEFWTTDNMKHLLWDEADMEHLMWVPLRDARKVELIDEYLKEDLSLIEAAEKADEIIAEEMKYSLKIYYYELADALGLNRSDKSC